MGIAISHDLILIHVHQIRIARRDPGYATLHLLHPQRFRLKRSHAIHDIFIVYIHDRLGVSQTHIPNHIHFAKTIRSGKESLFARTGSIIESNNYFF